MKKILLIMSAALMLSGTGAVLEKADAQTFIGKQQIHVPNGILTPEALWAMGRIGDLDVSPDGKKIVYTVSYYSVKENKSHRVIYTMNNDGTNVKLLTTSVKSEGDCVWIEGGKKIAFLSAENGKNQLWTMNQDGTDRKLVSGTDMEMEGFSFSPDGSKVLFIAEVPYDGAVKKGKDLYKDLDKTSGILVTGMMHRHWDEWVESIPHPFVGTFSNGTISNVRDVLQGEPFESPLKPFGGVEQLSWSPDGKKIAYTCRKKTGRDYAISTDADIYEYDVASGVTTNLCKPAGYSAPAVKADESLDRKSVV